MTSGILSTPEKRNCLLCGKEFLGFNVNSTFCCEDHLTIFTCDNGSGYVSEIFLAGIPLSCEGCGKDLTKDILSHRRTSLWAVHHRDSVHENNSAGNRELLCSPCHSKATWTGRSHTEETKRKMSLAKKGTIQSKESIEKRAAAMRGKARGPRASSKTPYGMRVAKCE